MSPLAEHARVVVLERTPGSFDRFRLEAIPAWCDLEPVLRLLYEQVLAGGRL